MVGPATWMGKKGRGLPKIIRRAEARVDAIPYLAHETLAGELADVGIERLCGNVPRASWASNRWARLLDQDASPPLNRLL